MITMQRITIILNWSWLQQKILFSPNRDKGEPSTGNFADILWGKILHHANGSGVSNVDNVLPSDDLWFGLDTYTNYGVLYNLYLDV